ncbi:MAG TPA: excinuclease ABC subunit C, partial [Flavobacteriia bacterium]|nr:excinuclease ABC subunit C [Flavobacteriia bacterium]
MIENLQLQIKTLPDAAGVYLYYDKNDTVIYVGKAKNLKKRVNSYFTKNHENGKTRVLVQKIVRMEHIVVQTETDALLLENNLIKKYQPRYNILLKDDKSYPFICIKKERFPRVFLTRRVIKDGSEYFGPYTSVRTARALLSLIKELYPLRTCNFNLSVENIQNNKHKVCLEYHIKNCKGPCEGLQTETDYNNDIKAIKNIIKGNFAQSLEYFKQKMHDYAAKTEFEEAQKIKEKLDLLQNYQAKSTIVNPSISNVDVFSILSDENFAYANFLKIINGNIIQSHTTEIKKKLAESDKEILELFIVEIRQRFNSITKEIYVPFKVDLGEDVKVTIPKVGDKKRIVELSLRNAKYYRQE